MTQVTYTYQRPGTYLDRLSSRKRIEMLDIFLSQFPGHQTESILDVGVTADRQYEASNFLEKYYPVKSKIIALSDQDASHLENQYPGLTFKRGDAKQLPFPDNSIDVVFSSAVIEHVGSRANQQKMIAECYRVAKRGVFITTPNRWYPVELHTLIPLLHWLPKQAHRFLLKHLGMTFYADESNLNLLDGKQLTQDCEDAGIQNYTISAIRTFGFKSNLVLVIKK